MRLFKLTDEGPIELTGGDTLEPGDRWVLHQEADDDAEGIERVLRSLTGPTEVA